MLKKLFLPLECNLCYKIIIMCNSYRSSFSSVKEMDPSVLASDATYQTENAKAIKGYGISNHIFSKLLEEPFD